MHWLNLPTTIIRSPEYVGSEPVVRATWFNLMTYCAEQENGGMIQGCESWKCRQWQQTCGITLEEAQHDSELWEWRDGHLLVKFYPNEKEAQVQKKRNSGALGGKAKSPDKAEAARVNGSSGGRPKTQAETQAQNGNNPSTTQAPEPENPSENPTEEKRREDMEEKKSNTPKPPEGGGDGFLLDADPVEGSKPRKPWLPTTRQLQINRWFRRRDTTEWSSKELRLFRSIPATPDEDWELLERYYLGPGDGRWPKHDVQTLLNNWLREIDKARKWASERIAATVKNEPKSVL